MKRLDKNIRKIRVIIIGTFFCWSMTLMASPVVQVNTVSGNVFSIVNGNAKTLKQGDHLDDFSEIVTEEGSQITFTDFYDHQYHMSGSGHIRFLNKIVELKSGYVWLQSYRDDDQLFTIQTANSLIQYSRGEAIISFDELNGKTQLLSIKGQFEMSNLLEKFKTLPVSAGHFSYISEDYEDGTPRKPTPIGYASFRKVTGLFSGISPMGGTRGTWMDQGIKKEPVQKANRGRSIASVEESVEVEQKPLEQENKPKSDLAEAIPSTSKSKIIYIKKDDQAEKQLKEFKLMNYYKEKINKMSQEKVKKKFAPDYSKKSNVILKIYGKIKKRKSARTPASIGPVEEKRLVRRPSSIHQLNPQVNIEQDSFESNLLKEYKKQMRHGQEVNQLIDDLKSYDQDYKKSY